MLSLITIKLNLSLKTPLLTFGAMRTAYQKLKFCIFVARFLTVATKNGKNRKRTRKKFDIRKSGNSIKKENETRRITQCWLLNS